jgi:hypothetical protein
MKILPFRRLWPWLAVTVAALDTLGIRAQGTAQSRTMLGTGMLIFEARMVLPGSCRNHRGFWRAGSRCGRDSLAC